MSDRNDYWDPQEEGEGWEKINLNPFTGEPIGMEFEIKARADEIARSIYYNAREDTTTELMIYTAVYIYEELTRLVQKVDSYRVKDITVHDVECWCLDALDAYRGGAR